MGTSSSKVFPNDAQPYVFLVKQALPKGNSDSLITDEMARKGYPLDEISVARVLPSRN
jgi:hypothetical protein